MHDSAFGSDFAGKRLNLWDVIIYGKAVYFEI
jgi:hypothetical protein